MSYQGRRAAVAGLAVTGLLLTACGSSEPAESAGLEEEQEINVWGWSGAPGAEIMADVIDAFEDEYPNITVNYNEVTNSDYANRATLGLSSEQEIDVIGVFPNEWAMDNEGYLLPVEEWPGVDGILDSLQDQALEQTGRLFSDGVARAVPLYSGGAPVAYYNVDLLEEAGVSEPPATWADMEALAAALEESSPETITALIPSDHWFQSDILLSLIGQHNPEFWNTLVYEDGAWDTDATRDGLALYRDAYASGALDRATLDVQSSDAMSLFGQGEAVMLLSGTWDAGLLRESFREANGIGASEVGVVPLPAENPDDRGIRAFLDTTFGIPAYSTKQEAAAKFIEFAAVGAGVDVWGSTLVGVPALEGWELPDDVLSSDIARAGYVTIQELVSNPHSDRYVLSNFENQQASYGLQVATGDLTPEEAAERGQDDLESGKYN